MRDYEDPCEYCHEIGRLLSHDQKYFVCKKHYKKLKKESRRVKQKLQTSGLRDSGSYGKPR